MGLRDQALSGFRWTASVRLLSQAITWAITLVVIRLLTPADYGLLAMATVLIEFLLVFSEFGIGLALVQKPELDMKTQRQAFGFVLLSNFTLALLLLLLAPFAGVFFEEPRVVPIVRVLALQFAIVAFGVVPNALLQRRMEFRQRSLMDLSGAIVASLTTLAMAFAGAGVWALIAGSMVNQLWRTVVLNLLAPFFHRPEFSLKGMRSLLTFGGRLTAAGLLGTFYGQIDVIICAKILGNELLGFYSVGVQLAAMPSQKILGLVNQIAFPTFARMQHDLQAVADSVLLGVRLLSFFAFPMMWGMSSVAPDLVEVVLGPQWSLAVVPLQALTLVIPLRVVGNFVGTAVQGMGHANLALRNTVWAALLAPPILYAGAFFAGLNGLSAAWLVITPALFVPAMMRCTPVIGLRTAQVFAAIMPTAGATFIMYVVVIGVRHALLDGFHGVLRLAGLIAVGALTYCVASLILNRRGAFEVLETLRGIATSRREATT